MSQKGFSLLFIILGIILVIGIAGGAYYLGKTQITKPQPPNPVVLAQTPQPTPASSVVPSSTSDETANWKTYTNTKYGYIIKYPDNWTLGGSGPGQTPEFLAQHFWIQLDGPQNCEAAKHCGSIIIQVKQLNETDLALSAKEIWLRYLSMNMQPAIDKEENIELGGIMATKVSYVNNFLGGQTSESTTPIPTKTVVLIHYKNLYIIDLREFLYPEGKVVSPKNANITEWIYDSLFNQILSTFKFIQ